MSTPRCTKQTFVWAMAFVVVVFVLNTGQSIFHVACVMPCLVSICKYNLHVFFYGVHYRGFIAPLLLKSVYWQDC